MCVLDFTTAADWDVLNDGKVEDMYQIMFRPTIGLRYPISEHLLIFSELNYDIVPERSLGTSEFREIVGNRAIFSAGTVIFGLSYQW